MNLKRRILTIVVEPLPGDDLNSLKRSIKEFCKEYKCNATFSHNGCNFIADTDGNICKL